MPDQSASAERAKRQGQRASSDGEAAYAIVVAETEIAASVDQRAQNLRLQLDARDVQRTQSLLRLHIRLRREQSTRESEPT